MVVLKIFIDGIIYSLQKHGGISVYFNELIERCCNDDRFELTLSIPKPVVSKCVPEDFQTYNGRMLERYRSVKLGTGHQIFHSSYYRVPANKKTPLVTTVHDFTYEKYVTGPAKHVHRLQKKRAIERAAQIICVSKSTANDLFSLYPHIKPERVSVVHNGVAGHFTPVPPKKAYESTVLFVGDRRRYKNFSNLVTAVSLTSSLKLCCVGGGAFREDELELLARLLPNRYSHAGFLADHCLNELYASAYCLAYPSEYEGFGIPVIEAMSAGCPVIATNRSSIPEVAGNAAILLDQAVPDSILEGLEKLSSLQLREKLVASGLKQAQKFSWNTTWLKTAKVYERII